jgi:hypothetical protein
VGSNGFNEKYAMRTDILLCTYICIYVKTKQNTVLFYVFQPMEQTRMLRDRFILVEMTTVPHILRLFREHTKRRHVWAQFGPNLG